jgi:hypothetical protein
MLTITMQFKSSFYVRVVERANTVALNYGWVLDWRYDAVVDVQLCGA